MFTINRKEEALQVLNQYFGYSEFRGGQEEIIESILSARDALGIMPTGAGKSICYQVPALLMKGITLIISPLISLMKDQVGTLNQAGIHAAFLNSSLTPYQYMKALHNAKNFQYKIIYVAPERLLTGEFVDFAINTEISMVCVDEAHCISQWGQDFRPSYLKIAQFIDFLPKRPILSAFTATATTEVRNDIIKILKLKTPKMVMTGFDRKNLYFEVRKPKDKYQMILQYLAEHKYQSGIIYCSTRKTVDEVWYNLKSEGFSVTRYHAGLSDEERKKNQENFIYDRLPIMIATNAFGMGIDKSNVNFVIHYNMPKDLESYYQEAGRAGRDGEAAQCILLYGGKDVVINQFFIDNNKENEELDEKTLKLVKQKDKERLKKMTYYCFTNDCLREYMLRYFGEYSSGYCGNCSNCLTKAKEMDVTHLAKGLLETVKKTKERYGINMILNIVKGSNNAKIQRYDMQKISTYASLSAENIKKLRMVINYLIIEEYLYLTNDEYPILKLTKRSNEVLNNNCCIKMKIFEEEKRENAITTKQNTKQIQFTPEHQTLLYRLKILRSYLAKEQKVPAYIIFSDKTLKEMTVLLPIEEEQMLKVPGIGKVKLEKYGKLFLKEIQDFLNKKESGTRI